MHTEQQSDKANLVTFIALLSILVPLELVCASLAYHTVGAVNSVVLKMAIGLNILPVIFYVFKHRIIAVLSALVLALMLVPNQVIDGYKLFLVQQEAANVVTYVYETRLKTGNFPANLSGYKFRNADFKENVEYKIDKEAGGFSVWYYVGNCHTAHWYQPDGGWLYYDD